MNEIVDFFGIKIACRPNSTDKDIATCIIGREGAESDEYHLRKLAVPGEIFVDIGAYGGHASLLAARLGMLCVAVEPLPDNVANLRENLALNDEGHCVTVIEGAIGCNKLFWNSQTDDFSVRHRFIAERRELDKATEVKVARVDLERLLADYHAIHIIKTDCEGGEWELTKMPRLLAKTKYIVGEFHQRDERTFADFRNEFPGFDDVSEEFGDKHQEPLRLFVFANKDFK